ncbi:MAG TPA: hypothetical protein DDZ83_07160 [Nitrospinae bacterium]|nr:hypothetical protein [Nitrospinota bacterium]
MGGGTVAGGGLKWSFWPGRREPDRLIFPEGDLLRSELPAPLFPPEGGRRRFFRRLADDADFFFGPSSDGREGWLPEAPVSWEMVKMRYPSKNGWGGDK